MFGGIPLEVIVGLVSGLGGFLMKLAAQRQADFVSLVRLGMEKNQQASKQADAAAKRSSPFARKVLAFFIIGICFGGLLIVAFRPDIPVSIVNPIPQKSLFWGLIQWGKSMEVTVAQGLVLSDWVRFSVISVVGFFFGTGAGKISKD